MAYCIITPTHGAAYFQWDDLPPSCVFLGLSCNLPISLDKLPNSATRSRGKQLPDFFVLAAFCVVNDRFRDMVERFEPSMHFFHPISLKEKDSTPIAGLHYIFCARQAVDFVLIAQSGLEWNDNGRDYPPHVHIHSAGWETHHPDHTNSRANSELKHGPSKSEFKWDKHLKVSGPAIVGKHLWTGDRVCDKDLWVSDAFFAAMEKAKIKFFQSTHYGFETEALWIPEIEMAPVTEWMARHAH